MLFEEHKIFIETVRQLNQEGNTNTAISNKLNIKTNNVSDIVRSFKNGRKISMRNIKKDNIETWIKNIIVHNDMLFIPINKIEEVDPNFHVRYSSKKKIYHYHLHCELFHNPCQRSYSHHVRHLFREEKVKEAILHFIGTHNFKAFANENSKGAASSSPVKTIYSIDLIKQPGGYRLEFEGNGFLYKMVRNIVGTLLECGKGKLEPSEIPNLIKSENRRLVPKSAPALGLFLVKIEY
jgi:tRNA pseudouridine(38-40) synthase